MQEFLGAVFIFHCYTDTRIDRLRDFFGKKFKIVSPEAFLEKAFKMSLVSPNGHLDLFIRFLHGLSLTSNRRMLIGLLGQIDIPQDCVRKACENLKEMMSSEYSPDRSVWGLCD